MSKSLCPWHDDRNPSLEVYSDGWVHCFVCGAHKTLEEYKATTGLTPLVAPPKPKEDIAPTLAAIKGMRVCNIRGLQLPTDGEYYYIVWPDSSYYLKRSLDPESKTRYIGPSGHQRPLYIAAQGMHSFSGRGKVLCIVEGEINAMSVAKALPSGFGVVSPGAATQFYSSFNAVSHYLKYDRQILIADEDQPGAMACINLARELQKQSRDVQCILMKKKKDGGRGDANEILEAEGPDALREELLSRFAPMQRTEL